MLRCRWTFQGLVWNELHGMQYPPFSCVAAGMPGASDAQIRQVVQSPAELQERLFCDTKRTAPVHHWTGRPVTFMCPP